MHRINEWGNAPHRAVALCSKGRRVLLRVTSCTSWISSLVQRADSRKFEGVNEYASNQRMGGEWGDAQTSEVLRSVRRAWPDRPPAKGVNEYASNQRMGNGWGEAQTSEVSRSVRRAWPDRHSKTSEVLGVTSRGGRPGYASAAAFVGE